MPEWPHPSVLAGNSVQLLDTAVLIMSGIQFKRICLNIRCASCIHIRVRFLKNILVVLVAVAWLPMTLHCRLETVPGLEFLACEAESRSDSVPSSDCGDTGCCSVEKSQYKTEQHRLTLLPPNFQPSPFAPVLDLANTLSDEASREAPAIAPPELPRCWQFIFRTASPPRAPSFAS